MAITVQRTRPHIYGADPIILFSQPLHTRFIPVYTGLECINTYYKTIREWLIPVYTGQMPLICRSRTSRKVHPRAYGADTKFLKQITVIRKTFFCLGLPQQNTFWSILARNDTYLGNCGVANSFPCIRGRSLIISPDVIKKWVHPVCTGRMPYPYQGCHLCLGSSPRIRGKSVQFDDYLTKQRFIPVCTGQILNPSGRLPCLVSHCFPSPWTFVTEPVCTILDSHIFADNTFWSILIRNDIF